MSHDHGGHDLCNLRFQIPLLHFNFPSVARGMTDVGVGSGALFGSFSTGNLSFVSSPRYADADESRAADRDFSRSAGTTSLVLAKAAAIAGTLCSTVVRQVSEFCRHSSTLSFSPRERRA